MSRYTLFDRRGVHLAPIKHRGHDLHAAECRPCQSPDSLWQHSELDAFMECWRGARRECRPVILMLGGHPIKLGLSRFLIDLMERGFITHVATNGAGIIHDFELALLGGTSEDVARWIRVGQFGLWQETSRLNDVVAEAARNGEGLGEAVGRTIEEERLVGQAALPVPASQTDRQGCLSYAELSIAAAGWRLGIPVTCHVSIGSDIIHAMPNCDGAALGQASYTDFLIFARAVQDLEGGIFINIGSAVTGPEVFLKALSMARNVSRGEGLSEATMLPPGGDGLPRRFTTAVFDLVPLPENYRDGTPGKEDPLYYFRPWKTLLCRTVAGDVFFF